MGRDRPMAIPMSAHFNPPIPCGMGLSTGGAAGVATDFNPPIPCGMGPAIAGIMGNMDAISIHPSRVGWDVSLYRVGSTDNISIHPSRVGWDKTADMAEFVQLVFQSTHPVWDGTFEQMFYSVPSRHFNPPIPCGMGPIICGLVALAVDFNPPIPCGMGRQLGELSCCYRRISIHPSRVGWDGATSVVRASPLIFQSTHPVWDGTSLFPQNPQRTTISIHPSRVGWDQRGRGAQKNDRNFNPPIPCGMGPYLSNKPQDEEAISIHPSRVGWDIKSAGNFFGLRLFQSTHPVWDGTRWRLSVSVSEQYFNPPIPCGMGLKTHERRS